MANGYKFTNPATGRKVSPGSKLAKKSGGQLGVGRHGGTSKHSPNKTGKGSKSHGVFGGKIGPAKAGSGGSGSGGG